MTFEVYYYNNNHDQCERVEKRPREMVGRGWQQRQSRSRGVRRSAAKRNLHGSYVWPCVWLRSRTRRHPSHSSHSLGNFDWRPSWLPASTGSLTAFNTTTRYRSPHRLYLEKLQYHMITHTCVCVCGCGCGCMITIWVFTYLIDKPVYTSGVLHHM